MDALVSSALEEICCRGSKGVSFSSLCSILTPTPDVSVKPALWANLLSNPSLHFSVPGSATPFLSPNDPRIQRFEDSENLNLKVVAGEHLKDSFFGIYCDAASSGVGPDKRLILERLAAARRNGVTQAQLAKGFNIQSRNFHYRVRNLECRGLIVRQTTSMNKKENDSEGETIKRHNNTNLICLSRYAKPLGAQQRLEINVSENVEESDEGGNDFEGEPSEGDVIVRDFLPEMKAVCDKLEEAHDKVLVVSDIKRALGYTRIKGHRGWRSICGRLKEACLVQDFTAQVNGKKCSCLRLLKKFDTKTLGRGRVSDEEQLFKFGRSFQQTEQLVELPIDHQICDMIGAKGTDGVLVNEVCRRLGIDRKRNDSRLNNLFSRFGMVVQKEKDNGSKVGEIRVWTSKNSDSEDPNAFLDESKIVLCENNTSTLNVDDHNVIDRSSLTFLEDNHSTSGVDFATSTKLDNTGIDAEPCGFPEDGQTNHELCPDKLPEFLHEPMGVSSDSKLAFVSTKMQMNAASGETTLLKLPDSGSYQAHLYLPLSTDGALREHRILERLQNEKFLLRKDIHRWLVSLEKNKRTVMDSKTVDRMVNKLQQEGRCKVVEVMLPAITNCTRAKCHPVILHPSVQNFPSEIMGEIHDRHRAFEKEIRGQASSKLKSDEPIPVLNCVTRTQIQRVSNEQAVKVEAMRANGFVLAKMVRAKLLHHFLWDYLSSFPGWDGTLSTSPCERTYKIFTLEAAVKGLPIKLFLQVVGTTKKSDNMTAKSKMGLLLSDLPVEEYKWLMDTQATGRLSLIIDILRRLKLIRLIHNGHSEDGVKLPHETFKHALELRPYIEEPLSVAVTSNLKSLDLRPRMRHDFILSNREAVDEYWNTLEYCFAAADRRAALHAFPGSAVPEVSHPRFWTSVRLISAHQKDELLKHIVIDDLNKKISYQACINIARDLNLSVHQVLHAYYGKHQQRLNIFQGSMNASEDDQAPKRNSSSVKRKRPLKSSSAKRGRSNAVNEQLGEEALKRLPDIVNQFMEEQEISPSEQHDDNLPSYHEDNHMESVEEPGSHQDKKHHSLISQYTFSKSQMVRRKRFSWTDADDRQLVIQYARHRAILGAKNHSIDWKKLPDLPASPKTCARRMASLKRKLQFRKALMKLCTMLGKRYAKHLEKTQGASFNKNDCRVLFRCSTSEGVNKFSNGVENAEEICFEEEQWDDFSDKSIEKAFEEVLLSKQMPNSERVGTAPEEFSNLNNNVVGYVLAMLLPSLSLYPALIASTVLGNSVESELVSAGTLDDNIPKDGQGKDFAQKSGPHHLHQKFAKCLNEGTFVSSKVHKSLAVSNAVELLKLVFLSTSAAPEIQNHVAETLRRYSEHDIFAAFSYLREKRMMIGGDGDQPFVLSQQFLQSVSKSPFPSNTGKRAAKFSGWLHEREKDLMEGGINLCSDLHCGDIFQLFALVSSGELFISPCVPDKGVGEAEDLRSLKRKADDECDGDKSKKMKSLADSELISRREKGFPGITVLVHRAKIMPVNAVEWFKDWETVIDDLHQNGKFKDVLGQKISSSSSQCDSIPEIPSFDGIVPAAKWSCESPWEAMVSYAEYLMLKPSDPERSSLFSPEVFRTVFMAIQKAGDQGLSSEEVSGVVGENVHEHIIDVLLAFGYVIKVNAYDTVHVVDALYHSKYFLTSLAAFLHNHNPHSLMKCLQRSENGHSVSNHDVPVSSSQGEAIVSEHRSHKVTILNLPEDVVPSIETQRSNIAEGSLQDEVILPGQYSDGETHKFSSNESHVPILPWVNGNGSINKVVYNALVRRVLGIVMQNPGILEDNIIHQIDALNPQSCRNLLGLMILDKHLIVRKMHQSTSSGPPALLGSLLRSSFRGSKSVYRKHLFANPMSASLL